MLVVVKKVIWESLIGYWKVTEFYIHLPMTLVMGAQWLSGRVLDSRPKGRGFQRHCVVVLEQDTFILA